MESSDPAERIEREERAEEYREPVPERTERPASKPASEASVQAAIEQVNQIIESLRESLDEMESVLETLELAERQKNADEYEIDNLRRALNRLQRHRESGPSRENR